MFVRVLSQHVSAHLCAHTATDGFSSSTHLAIQQPVCVLQQAPYSICVCVCQNRHVHIHAHKCLQRELDLRGRRSPW